MKVDRDIRTIGPLCLINNYSLRIVLTWIRINRIYEYLGYSRKREQWDQDLSSERIGRSVDLILKRNYFSFQLARIFRGDCFQRNLISITYRLNKIDLILKLKLFFLFLFLFLDWIIQLIRNWIVRSKIG